MARYARSQGLVRQDRNGRQEYPLTYLAVDSSKSSSFKFISSDFNISYVDGSGATGDYVSDTFHIGGKSLDNQQFGIGYDSSSAQGILGIGYPSNEVQVNRNDKESYANVPKAMANAGVIQSNAYSLWLNDLDANTGSILFGGVNTGKYHGSLQTVDILQEDGMFVEFVIPMTGVGLSYQGKNTSYAASSFPAPVLLDSGSSLVYLPNAATQQIYDAVDAEYVEQEGSAYVPCSLMSADASIDFTFSSQTISVSMQELVIETTDENGNQPTFDDGTPACIFGIAPADGTTPVLGDTFLRSAYVVYDLANNQISLAQTNFNSTTNDVREIGTGVTAVPDATSVASQVTALAAQTGGARIQAQGTGSAVLTGSPTGALASAGATSSPTGAANQAQVPLAVAAGAAGFGLWMGL